MNTTTGTKMGKLLVENFMIHVVMLFVAQLIVLIMCGLMMRSAVANNGVEMRGIVTDVVRYVGLCGTTQYCYKYNTSLRSELAGNTITLRRQYNNEYLIGHELQLRVDPITGENVEKLTVEIQCGIALIVFSAAAMLGVLAMLSYAGAIDSSPL